LQYERLHRIDPWARTNALAASRIEVVVRLARRSFPYVIT
jgi:hypothetical protein